MLLEIRAHYASYIQQAILILCLPNIDPTLFLLNEVRCQVHTNTKLEFGIA